MKKFPFVLLAALVLAGCVTRPPKQQPAPIEPVQPPPSQPSAPPPVSRVPTPPKLVTIDWQSSVAPLVQQMLATQGIAPGSVLLINTIKNNTNGSLQTAKATDALYNALASNATFKIVSQAQLTSARQALGLSAEDSLESRGKAMGLARYVNAQYVLYTTADGDAKLPELDMQLMLVQTGEIIWSGKGATQDQQ
ncbi:penicillin-binding protein activator LpoB [Martelella alba]|uniref:Penicillin-binding protein activator LpoB n=1 Tax=Martelella alba TaxID=2590451 RepID=A0ABY2SPW0_9HYPH|nr:penicillin-binding protein activator LpoB [Martelella alba]TKI07711.1 penicillin-binding protein activator LpoB [Martelella alba]